MNTNCHTFDLGEIFVTRGVSSLLMHDTIACALQCHARHASYAHRLDTGMDVLLSPRLIRTTHLCCDDQQDRHVAFDVITLLHANSTCTVVHLSDHGCDYGSVQVKLTRFDPDEGVAMQV